LKKAYDRSGAAPEPAAALARYYFDRLDPSRSLAVSQTALIGSPDTPDLLKIAGQAQLVSGATSQAVATFRRLVTVKPDSSHNHFLLASAYLNQGDLDRTNSSLEQVLKLNPGHIGSKAFLVRILAHRRELDHAKALVADLKANAPQDYQVVRADAAVKIADGRLDDAVQTLRDVIDLPGAIRRRLPVTLAALEWQAGAHSESQSRLQGWLEKAPADWRARMVLASQYVDQKDFANARDAYAIVAESQPENWLAKSSLGWVLIRLGNLAEAGGPVESALELAPDRAQVVGTAGYYYLEQGDHEKALELLARAAKALQDNPDVQYQYGRALSAAGRDAEAIDVLRMALDSKGHFLDRADAEKLINKLQGG